MLAFPDDDLSAVAIRGAAKARYLSLDHRVWEPLPDAEPDVMEAVAIAYGGLPAYDAECPVGVAGVVACLFGCWPRKRQVALVQACSGCGCLSAYMAVCMAAQLRKRRKEVQQ
jgi:hypothetical protein